MSVTRKEFLKVATELYGALYKWQKEIIFDNTSKKIRMNCGRKSGKTSVVELRSAWRFLNDDIKAVTGLRGGIGIVSNKESNAKEILSAIKTILEQLGWSFTEDQPLAHDETKVAYSTTMKIQRQNKNRISVHAAGEKGDSIRNWSFHELAYDECESIPDLVYTAAKFCLGKFNGVELLEGTPNIKGNRKCYGARAFFDSKLGYKVYHISTEDCPHIDPKWLADCKATMTEEEYDREVRALYTSDIGAIFPERIIMMEKHNLELETSAENIYIGASYARLGQRENCIASGYLKNGKLYVKIELIKNDVKRISEVENAIVRRVEKNSRVTAVIVDHKSMGSTPVESLAGKIGQYMLIGVSSHDWTKPIEGEKKKYNQEDLYINMLHLMEEGKIVFDTDPRILDALMTCKKEYADRTGILHVWSDDYAVTEAIVRCVFTVWGRAMWTGDVSQDLFKPIKL